MGADPELVDAWLERARAAAAAAGTCCNMSRVLEDSPLLGVRSSAALRAPRRACIARDSSSRLTTCALPASYEEYLAARSGKFRNYLQARREAVSAGAGAVASRSSAATPTSARASTKCWTSSASSWKHAHGTAISAVAHQSGFYRDLCAGAREAGMLHLSFLRLDGAALAYNLGVIVGGPLTTISRRATSSSGANTASRPSDARG